MHSRADRRRFMELAATGATWSLASGLALMGGRASADAAMAAASSAGTIPKRTLGKTGAQVSILGLGGSHLGDVPDPDQALRIVHEAIDAGVTFFDNAWEYH